MRNATDTTTLSWAEQRHRGVWRPRGRCSVCTVEYGITESNTMYKHGARGNPCTGSYQPARGLDEVKD